MQIDPTTGNPLTTSVVDTVRRLFGFSTPSATGGGNLSKKTRAANKATYGNELGQGLPTTQLFGLRNSNYFRKAAASKTARSTTPLTSRVPTGGGQTRLAKKMDRANHGIQLNRDQRTA